MVISNPPPSSGPNGPETSDVLLSALGSAAPRSGDGAGPHASEEPRPSAAGLRGRFAATETSSPPPTVRLVLQGALPAPPDSIPLRLARVLGLDAWGDFLIGHRVAQEMGAAAFILLVVLVFEFLSWSLLFNVLVHSAQWAWSWRTVLACLLAAVFAGGVFLFERSFITADLGESPFKKWLAYGLRFGIIAGACIATSQPLELLVFGGAVETRLRDENALAEAVHLVERRQQYATDSRSKSAGTIEEILAPTSAAKDLKAYRTQRDERDRAVRELEAGLTNTDAQIAAREAEVGRRRERVNALNRDVQRELDPQEGAELQRRLAGAQNALAASQERLRQDRQRKLSLEEQLRNARVDLQAVSDSLKDADSKFLKIVNQEKQQQLKIQLQAKADLDELESWMHEVQNVEPGRPTQKRPKTGKALLPKAADFTDRLRVLDDLRAPRRPLWPAASDRAIADAVTTFHLEGPYGQEDPVLSARRHAAASLFSRTYWIAFVIAAVIPLLTLAFKLMMSQDLAAYYSATAQARGGNPEAILALHARGMDLESLSGPSGRRLWQRIRSRFWG